MLVTLSVVLTAYLPPPRPLLRTTTLAMCGLPKLDTAEIEGMAYRQLQQLCKAHGLGAKGKADELRAKLLGAAEPNEASPLVESINAPPPPTPHAPAAAEDAATDDHFDDLLDLLEEDEFDDGEAPIPAPPIDESFPGLDAAGIAEDDLAEQKGKETGDDAFDDSLFDELLSDLSVEEPFGTYRSPGESAGSATGASVPNADNGSVESALAALDDLDFDNPIAANGEGSEKVEVDTFDEAWLDDLFGPIGEMGSSSGGAQAGGDAGRPAYQSRPRGRGRHIEDIAVPSLEENSDDPNAGLRRAILLAAREGDDRKTLNKLKKWRNNKLPVEDQLYTVGLYACERMGAWETAATLINEIEDFGLAFSTEHFDAALRACDRHARWQEGLVLFDRMVAAGLQPTARSYECVIRTAAKAGQRSMVMMLWDTMRDDMKADQPLEPSLFTYNVLMRALAEDGGKKGASNERTDAARQVLKAFDEAVNLGLPIDESAFKHALRAADISADWRRALALLEDMESRGVRPDTLCFGNVMSACARNGRAATVLSLMGRMRAANLQPNAFCYNAAVGAASRAGKWRQAIGLMDDMEEEAAQQGNPSIAPTAHTYTAVLKACALVGQSRAANNLIFRMQRSGFEPDAYHFGTVIDACGRAGDMGKVMSLMREMEKRGLQPDVKTFTTALTACARENQLNRALSLIERMYKLEVPPDVATYNVLLQACDKQDKYDIIAQLIDSMPALGVEPNIVNYNTAIRACTRSGDQKTVDDLFSTMRQRDIQPSFSTYRAAINGSCTGGNMDMAISFLEQMKGAGFQPDGHVQYAFLSTCGEEERPFLESALGGANSEHVLATAWQNPSPFEDRRNPFGRGRGRGRGFGGRGGGRGRVSQGPATGATAARLAADAAAAASSKQLEPAGGMGERGAAQETIAAEEVSAALES